MTSALILNMILCGAAVVAVVAPLVWAILTARRDTPAVIADIRPRRAAAPARRIRRQPIAARRSGGARQGQASPTA